MKYKTHVVLLLVFNAFIIHPSNIQTHAQTTPSKIVCRFSVHSGKYKRANTPVSVSLKEVPLELQTKKFQLFEIVDGQEIPVASQLDDNYNMEFRWILRGETEAGKTRNFVLKHVPHEQFVDASDDNVQVKDNGKSLTIVTAGKKVLNYRYALKFYPDGVSELFARGGYIHPLWSPSGEVLTSIQLQPKDDHHHHDGIWSAWKKMKFEGRSVNTFSLGYGKGTVRPQGIPEKISGKVFGGFEAILNQVDLRAPTSSGKKVALKEKWNVKVWNVDPDQKVWLIDFASTLNPASESPVTIKPYRYQGFSFRATQKWNDKTANILTSKGKDKSNGNATRARWVDVSGVSKAGTSGILFMTYPGNHNFPERLRIWPTGANDGKANVYINFNPAQKHEWKLLPGNTYTLKYRMMVYDGEIDSTENWRYWNDFAHPPKVDIKRADSHHNAKE